MFEEIRHTTSKYLFSLRETQHRLKHNLIIVNLSNKHAPKYLPAQTKLFFITVNRSQRTNNSLFKRKLHQHNYQKLLFLCWHNMYLFTTKYDHWSFIPSSAGFCRSHPHSSLCQQVYFFAEVNNSFFWI